MENDKRMDLTADFSTLRGLNKGLDKNFNRITMSRITPIDNFDGQTSLDPSFEPIRSPLEGFAYFSFGLKDFRRFFRRC